MTKHGHVKETRVKAHASEFRRVVRVFLGRRIVIFGVVTIAGLIICALLAPYLAPYDPYEQNLSGALQKPGFNHWLGTDAVGRDTLSRIIYGTRTSLMIGIVAVAIAALIGMTLGLIAGFFGGKGYTFIMRFIDAMMCFPPILMALILAGILGAGMKNVMFAIGIALIPAYCRLMCAQVLSVRENDYVTAARSIGATNIRVMIRHILPNCFPPLIVLITVNIGMAILSEAGLSFLGLGIEAPKAAWGKMVSDGYLYLRTQPVLSFAPGLAIMLVVFAFNMVGDGLRDALDPKLRGTL
ncbi:MAG TPA: ABC transporter permease [Syntrophorhabdaceae bacterium]|nr:ABC transporter permease [Syntrophorhabdaceae bacterium]